MAEINDLSITDASNTARFPENQAASTVNDGARGLEGIVARWHKDTNGSLVAGGSSSAYTVAANQTLSAYYDGLTIAFEANHTNTGATTLNVDAVGAQAVVWTDGTALIAGAITSGGKYVVSYDADNTQWMLMTGARLIDEDAMGSDSAVVAPTQQSVKAYVDNTVAAATTGTLTAGTALVKNPFVAGSSTAQAHGLGAIPDFVKFELECLSADLNYSTGDVIDLFSGVGGTASSAIFIAGMSVVKDATNLTLLLAGLPPIPNKTSFSLATQPTATKWKVTLTPYKLN